MNNPTKPALDVPSPFEWFQVPVPDGVEDLTQRRSGKLLVLWATRGPQGDLRWMCRCDCGREKAFPGYPIRTGYLTACGCRAVKDPFGIRKTRLYRIWRNMTNRCAAGGSARYAGRGIAVCAEWRDYSVFAQWAAANGYNDTLSIDRIDNDQGYQPHNCRWTNATTQARNTSRTIWVDYQGERMSLPEAAQRAGVDYAKVYSHMKRRDRNFCEAVAHVGRATMPSHPKEEE